MKDIKFRVWHKKEKRMYFRGYQKWLHVLLCEDDKGENGGKGKPVKRASYEDCEFLESTTFFDKHGKEIYEGDIVRIRHDGKVFEEEVGPVPDSFGSTARHPLADLLSKHGISGNPQNLDVELIGNRYEKHPSAQR